ncbi:MAG: adenylyltransferase/cytidyltransferase family protein [Planctomycetes bacterium]|nr:adenylyltransferase/cytidyltransferase family protein [Planctomycetota bacterium]
MMSSAKWVDLDTLLRLRHTWRTQGRTVVWTNGCFDLVHVGHVRNLQAAREMGDVLVVGINSDDSVRRLKGPTRPLIPARERAEILAALEVVGFVVVFDEVTPEAVIARLEPDVCCKGADYAPPAGKACPEASIVRSYGGRMEYLALTGGHSTTDMIHRIKAVSESPG